MDGYLYMAYGKILPTDLYNGKLGSTTKTLVHTVDHENYNGLPLHKNEKIIWTIYPLLKSSSMPQTININ